MEGKVIVITGATSGIGKATAIALAKTGATIVLACRNKDKGAQVVDHIQTETNNRNLHILIVDLSLLQSVRNASVTLLRDFDVPHVLINNAAYLGSKLTTDEGLDYTFTANYLGHFLLTKSILEHMKPNDAGRIRIINVISDSVAKNEINFDDVMYEKDKSNYEMYKVYGQSKLALWMFHEEILKRFANVESFAVNPGPVNTDLLRNWPGMFGTMLRYVARKFFKTPEEAAKTIVMCACDNNLRSSAGLVYGNEMAKLCPQPTRFSDDAARLWDLSSRLCDL